jgi:hypothetical protein
VVESWAGPKDSREYWTCSTRDLVVINTTERGESIGWYAYVCMMARWGATNKKWWRTGQNLTTEGSHGPAAQDLETAVRQ